MSFPGPISALDYDSSDGFNVDLNVDLKTLVVASPGTNSLLRGEAFQFGSFQTIGNAVDLDFVVASPAANLNVFEMLINTTGQSTVAVYENPTLGAAGTARVGLNLNRNSGTSAAVTIDEGQTISAVGTLLVQQSAGQVTTGNSSLGGDLGGNATIVLKNSEDYLIRISSLAAGNIINYRFLWLEVTPRT